LMLAANPNPSPSPSSARPLPTPPSSSPTPTTSSRFAGNRRMPVLGREMEVLRHRRVGREEEWDSLDGCFFCELIFGRAISFLRVEVEFVLVRLFPPISRTAILTFFSFPLLVSVSSSVLRSISDWGSTTTVRSFLSPLPTSRSHHNLHLPPLHFPSPSLLSNLISLFQLLRLQEQPTTLEAGTLCLIANSGATSLPSSTISPAISSEESQDRGGVVEEVERVGRRGGVGMRVCEAGQRRVLLEEEEFGRLGLSLVRFGG